MKRRVIAIAVVVMVAILVGMNWEPLWRAVMLKKVLDTSSSPDMVALSWVSRWEEDAGLKYGPCWTLYDDGTVSYEQLGKWGRINWEGVVTLWDSERRVHSQYRRGKRLIERDSPPWWPPPPLIDLREFEE